MSVGMFTGWLRMSFVPDTGCWQRCKFNCLLSDSTVQKQSYKWHSQLQVISDFSVYLQKAFYFLLTIFFLTHEEKTKIAQCCHLSPLFRLAAPVGLKSRQKVLLSHLPSICSQNAQPPTCAQKIRAVFNTGTNSFSVLL